VNLRKAAHLIVLLVFLFGTRCGWGADTPRVALFASPDAADFGAVLTAELSKLNTLQLVERTELDRIAAEQGLPGADAPERPLALAKLAKANGLLFIQTDRTDPASSLLILRLTQTNDGVVRKAIVLPLLKTEMETNAQLAAAQLKSSFAFLQNQNTPTRAISFQGLHAAVDHPALRGLEMGLNTLLAHRLAREPGLVLLERWKLDDVIFERALSKLQSPALATGTELLDGSFTEQDGIITVKLQLHQAKGGGGATLPVQGNIKDPEALVEALAEAITGQKSTKPETWQPKEEANTYARLGAWLVKHKLPAQAAEAFESAVALGDTAPATLTGRAQAYAMCAYPDNLRNTYGQDTGYRRGVLKSEDLSVHLAAALRATQDTDDYLEAHLDAVPPKMWSLQTPTVLASAVFYTALRTLRATHEAGLHLTHATLVHSLRMEVRRLIRLMEASPAKLNGSYHSCKADYAAYWCENPQETLDYYRLILTPEFSRQLRNEFTSSWAAAVRGNFAGQHGPFLDEITPPDAERHERPGTQRLIDWSAADSRTVIPLWKNYIASLRTSSQPLEQADGLGFDLSAHRDVKARQHLFGEMIDFLEVHRDLLCSTEGEPLFASLSSGLQRAWTDPQMAAAHVRIMQWLIDVFDHSAWVPRSYLFRLAEMLISKPEANFHEDQARQLVTVMNHYEDRAQKSRRWNPEYASILRSLRTQVLLLFPTLGAEQSNLGRREALTVSRLWNSYLRTDFAKYGITGQTLCAFEDQLWLGAGSKGLIRFSPATFQTTLMPSPAGEPYFFVREILPTPKTIFVSTGGALWRYDRISQQWSRENLPPSEYHLREIGGDVYITFADAHGYYKSSGGGLGKLTDQDVQWLFSTRRRPIEHALDEADARDVPFLLPGCNSEIWAAIYPQGIGPMAAVWSLSAPQKPLLTFESLAHISPNGSRTLVWNTSSYRTGSLVTRVWRIDPKKAQPELLLHDASHHTPPEDLMPRWQMPEDWEVPPRSSGANWCLCAHPSKDEIWLLRWEMSVEGSLDLYVFRDGRTGPVHIPLRLTLRTEDEQALPRGGNVLNRLTQPQIEPEGMVATSHGLAFSGVSCAGVWTIPWGDLEKWEKDHPRAEKATQTTPPTK